MFPEIAYAATPASFQEFMGRVSTYIINPFIGLLFAVALAYFIWGVFVFIQNYESDTERQAGQRHMLWGIVGMFIMIAVYGIINVITGTFGLPQVR